MLVNVFLDITLKTHDKIKSNYILDFIKIGIFVIQDTPSRKENPQKGENIYKLYI